MKTSLILQNLMILSGLTVLSAVVIKLTNLKCQTNDQDYAQVQKCLLKVVGRNKVSMNIHIKLLQTKPPIRNITLQAQLMRKSVDYRKFMYSMKYDFCEFFKNRNKFLFWKIYLEELLPYTNINHSCPFDHDLIIKNFMVTNKFARFVPLPAGDYMTQISIYTYNKLQGTVKTYFSAKNR